MEAQADPHSKRSAWRTRRQACAAALLALLVAAALLRTIGIDYLLPEVVNTDGMAILEQAQYFRGATSEVSWWITAYPHLLARLVALWPVRTLAPGEVLGLEEHLALASEPWVHARIVAVALSLIAIPATYILARRFLDRAGALFSAALVATSLLHVGLSIQEKPHGPATSLALLALLAALALRRRPTATRYLLAGLAAALALGMLHNASLCLPALAAAFFLRDRDAGRRPGWGSGWWILVPLALVAVSARLFYPFQFEAPYATGAEPAITEESFPRFLARLSGMLDGAPLGRIVPALFGSDPLLFVLATAGVLVWLARAARDRGRRVHGEFAVVLAFVLPYLLVLGLFRSTLVRFFLPLVPVFACAAGFAFSRFVALAGSRLGSSRARAAVAIASGVLLLALPSVPAVHFARIRARPGPLDEAAQWIETNVRPDEPIFVLPVRDVPLFPTEEAARESADTHATIWSAYVARAPRESFAGERWPILVEPGERPLSRTEFMRDPVEYVRRYGARYVVLDLVGGGAALLEARMTRVARFSPLCVDDGSAAGALLWGTGYDRLSPRASSICDLRSFGTAVEIYRVP